MTDTRTLMLWAFKLQGCADCPKKPVQVGGELEMWELHCDHRPGETKAITGTTVLGGGGGSLNSGGNNRGNSHGYPALFAELCKCDVVCIECHLKRHRERRKNGQPHDPHVDFTPSDYEFASLIDCEQLTLT